ncbi:phage gene 29 protein family protein [Dietzia sp. MNB45]|uniref:phage gene 29 protein family protein n=1 Tax=Dietzia sp. MNB45 TaxID=3238800 RepID=UPI003F81152E
MIPMQERADMADPEQHAAWLFIGLQMSSGDTLNFHPRDAARASRQLWQAGFRHHPELQSHKMAIPGGPNQQFLAAAGGDWVPVDTPEPAARVASREVDISGMSLAECVDLEAHLRARELGSPPPPPRGLRTFNLSGLTDAQCVALREHLTARGVGQHDQEPPKGPEGATVRQADQ